MREPDAVFPRQQHHRGHQRRQHDAAPEHRGRAQSTRKLLHRRGEMASRIIDRHRAGLGGNRLHDKDALNSLVLASTAVHCAGVSLMVPPSLLLNQLSTAGRGVSGVTLYFMTRSVVASTTAGSPHPKPCCIASDLATTQRCSPMPMRMKSRALAFRPASGTALKNSSAASSELVRLKARLSARPSTIAAQRPGSFSSTPGVVTMWPP